MLVSNSKAVPDDASRLPDDTRRDASHDGPAASPAKGGNERLLSLASHELRTPVSVISGYLRMLQRDAASLTDRQRKKVDEAEKACVKLVGLLGEISELAQLGDGRTRLKTEAFDLLVLLHEIVDQANMTSDRGIRVVLRGGEGPAMMHGDAGPLRTAFSSLVRAAVREQHDDTLGWDYPAQKRLFEAQGLPTLLLVHQPYRNPDAAAQLAKQSAALAPWLAALSAQEPA